MKIAPPTEGILAALWLPTDADGALLRPELARHLDFLKHTGISGVLALGSTGEFPQFTLEERKAALALIAELAAPLPVIANISDIRPRAVAELGSFARRLGLPAVAIMTPGFFPSSQNDCLAHFLHAAEASSLPTMLYNFPELTGTRIDLETVAAFADRAKMLAIKQSGREVEYSRQLIALGQEKRFSVFSGADTRLPEVFGWGAAGCIGGLVNIVPEYMIQMFRIAKKGSPAPLSPAFERIKHVGASIDRLTFPLNVAAGLEARGFAPGAPKAVVSPQSRQLYSQIVTELRANLTAWKLVNG